MKFSEAGLDLIKRSEGFRPHVYKDVAGVPTVGYGHKLLAGEHFANGIDEPTALRILALGVAGAEAAVSRMVKVPLTQGQFDALVDWTYNLGAGRLASSTMLKVLNQGHYDQALEQLMLWVHAGGKEQPGLVARRNEERILWEAK